MNDIRPCGNNEKWCESCVSKGKCNYTKKQDIIAEFEKIKANVGTKKMQLDEAIKRMENVIICEKCHVSGKECNDNCPTQYDAGTVGECIEAMETILDFVKSNRGSEQERWLRGE